MSVGSVGMWGMMLGLVMGPAWGAPATASCFCLRHEPSGAIMMGCREIRDPNAPRPDYSCLEKNGQDRKIIPLPAGTPWQRVAAGEAGCTPCAGGQKDVPIDAVRGQAGLK